MTGSSGATTPRNAWDRIQRPSMSTIATRHVSVINRYRIEVEDFTSMNKLIGFALTVSLASAASLPTAKISGSYIEARNADVYTGACYANSEINLVGDLAV